MIVLPESIRAESFTLRYNREFFSIDKKNKRFYTESSNLGWADDVVPDFFFLDNPEKHKPTRFDLMEIAYKDDGRFDKFMFTCEEDSTTAVIYANY